MSVVNLAIDAVERVEDSDYPRAVVCIRERLLIAAFALLSANAFLLGPPAVAGTDGLLQSAVRCVGPIWYILASMLTMLLCVLAGVIFAKKNTIVGAVAALAIWFLIGYVLAAVFPPALLFPAVAVGDLSLILLVMCLWWNAPIWLAPIIAGCLFIWLAPAYVELFGFRILPSLVVRLILSAGVAFANLLVVFLMRTTRSGLLRSAVLVTLSAQAMVATAFIDGAIAALLRRGSS